MDVEERLQRVEAELEFLGPLRSLAVPNAPDMISEWARTSMLLLRLSAIAGTLCAINGVPADLARRWVMAMVAPQPGPELGPLTDQVMDALMLANGNMAGSA